MTYGDLALKDVRKTLWWGDPTEYKHRVNYYKRNKLTELRDLGYNEIGGISLRNPQELDEVVLDEDFWRRKTRDLWQRESPDTKHEIFDWYGSHTEYLAENMIRQAEVVDDIRQCYYWIRENDVEYVLDYGGGIGDFSLFHAYQGYTVVYADVVGSFPKLVNSRVEARPDVDLKVVPIIKPSWAPDNVVTGFDAAICLEVIEHLPHVETVIDGFAEALNSGGILISSWTYNDWSNDPDDVYTPCHINVGRDRSRETREYVERYFEEIDHTWNAQMRLWRRK